MKPDTLWINPEIVVRIPPSLRYTAAGTLIRINQGSADFMRILDSIYLRSSAVFFWSLRCLPVAGSNPQTDA